MRLVLHHKPSSPLGHAALIRLYETMARDPSTGGAGAVRARLADAYRAAGHGAPAPARGAASFSRRAASSC